MSELEHIENVDGEGTISFVDELKQGMDYRFSKLLKNSLIFFFTFTAN